MSTATPRDLLDLLQRMLDLPALDVGVALTSAATYVAEWLSCDKVDVFLVDPGRTSLVALGTSETPLGRRQKELGLDVLSLANGGRIVDTFKTQVAYRTGRADEDEGELLGIVHHLGVRSSLHVPFGVDGSQRGVLSATDQKPDRFSTDDLRMLGVVAGWMGALTHRAELAQQVRDEESARARTTAAEQIITVLSHDIRNHLSPLSGRLLLLQQRLRRGEPVSPAALDPALAAVRRLIRLTNSWLDISRLDQDLFEPELELVELCAILRDAAAQLATASVPIEVQAPDELTVLGDRERLTQAFENVIANGVRHSPAGRPLRISVERDERQSSARVRIVDEGPGVAPELLPHLFERFVSTRPNRGIGLGLYLAERVAVAHGGSLHVRSELGAGAAFEFQLPCDGPVRPLAE